MITWRWAYDPFVSRHPSIVVFNAAILVVWKMGRETDVAILRAHQKPSEIYGQLVSGISSETPQSPMATQGASLNPNYPTLGESLSVSGYPLGGHVLIFQQGIATSLGFPTSTSTSGLRIMMSIISNPSNSGGPVLNCNAEVIGLLEGYLQVDIRDANGNHGLPNSGISFAVPARCISELAAKYHIPLK
jgi:S1-C subfamily serine protease